MTKNYLLVVLLIGRLSMAWSQEKKLSVPVKLSDNINTRYDESNPLLSTDGKTLYFVRTGDPSNVGGKNAGQDIWYSTLENGEWLKASNDFQLLNNGDNNAVIGVNQHGNKLFLINTYSPHARRTRGVVSTTLVENKWTAPRELGLDVKALSDFYGFYMTPEEDLLLISMMSHESLGEEDLYMSMKNEGNSWTTPLHLGAVVNSPGYEMSPFLSADRKTLYFASSGHGGYGDADIFKSERLDDTWQSWSTPQNLGEGVNSEGFDAFYVEYEDRAFFSSNRGAKQSDIYTFDIVAEKKEQAPGAVATSGEEAEEEEPEITEAAAEEEIEEVIESAPKPEPVNRNFTIYFGFDTYAIDAAGEKVLDEVLALVKNHEVPGLQLEGHADNQGPKEYNLALSEKRARAVQQYLSERAGEQLDISIRAAGDDHPVASNDLLEERKKNRRVEISFEQVNQP